MTSIEPRELESDRKRTVVLGVTGSIAAFKSVEIARLLLQHGFRVLPVLTRSGARIVGPITFAGICGQPAHGDMWDPSFPGELHVHLAAQADLVLVAPATADIIARMAGGRADDLLTAVLLCAGTASRVVVAPAMHPRMWAHPATQRNVATLRSDGRVEWVGPVEGEVADGTVGMGRMAEPLSIVEHVMQGARDLAGLRIVVTAGPTAEDIDPVRFMSNRSTGRMGFAVANRAAARGASVTLISGPVQLPTPLGTHRVDVRTALEMRNALTEAMGENLDGADALVMAAAVGDYRPAVTHSDKQKRSSASVQLELVPNPDLLAEVGAARAHAPPWLIGFAVESATDERLTSYAHGKLQKKNVDLIVANSASDGFGKDTNRAALVERDHITSLPLMSKTELSDRILDRLRDWVGEKER